MVRALACALVFALCSSARAADKLWVVSPVPGPDVDFASIAEAIAAATDGDIILVREGTYAGDHLIDAKALVLAADTGASPTIQGALGVRNLTPGQSVAVRGLEVVADTDTWPALRLISNSGAVWIEGCRLQGFNLPASQDPFKVYEGTDGARISGCASVVLSDCLVLGGAVTQAAPALESFGSNLHVFGSVLLGQQADCNFALPVECGSASEAVHVKGGHTTVQSSTLQGGKATYTPGGCWTTTPGGPGIVVEAGTADLYDVTLIPGEGSPPCGGPSPYPAFVYTFASFSNEAGEGLSLHIPSPLPAGGSSSLTIEGAPQDLVFVLASAEPGDDWLPKFHGPLLIGEAALVLPLLMIDATGAAALPFAVPPLPAGVEGAPFVLQAARVSATGGLLANPMRIVLVAQGP